MKMWLQLKIFCLLGILFTCNMVSGQTRYKVLLSFTNKVQNDWYWRAFAPTSDLQTMIQLALDETNMIYENSGINARIQLARLVKYDTPDSDNTVASMLDGFHLHRPGESYWGAGDGDFMTYAADLSGAIVGSWNDVLAGAATDWDSTAVFVVRMTTLAGSGYEIAHEIGHIFGAAHDTMFAASSGLALYPFGYDMYNKPRTTNSAERWREVMAYECDTSLVRGSSYYYPFWAPDTVCPAHHPRVPYFSNTYTTYPPTGEPMGDTVKFNVARIHNIRIDTVAAFQKEKHFLHLKDTIYQDEIGNPEAIDSMLVDSFLVKGDGQLNIKVGKSVSFHHFEMRDSSILSLYIGTVTGGPFAKQNIGIQPDVNGAIAASAFRGEPPQVFRRGKNLYLLNPGPSENIRLTGFDVHGRRVISLGLSNIAGKSREGVLVFSDLPAGLLVFRLDSDRGAFWNKINPR